ncbi:MAG: hypothetical protein WBJ37_06040 [Bacteroidales bacterium]
MNFRSKIKALYRRIISGMSANNNPLFIFFYKYFYYPPEGTIEEFTDIFSRLRGKIKVVQVGANDGITNDPIHKFIKRDG